MAGRAVKDPALPVVQGHGAPRCTPRA